MSQHKPKAHQIPDIIETKNLNTTDPGWCNTYHQEGGAIQPLERGEGTPMEDCWVTKEKTVVFYFITLKDGQRNENWRAYFEYIKHLTKPYVTILVI